MNIVLIPCWQRPEMLYVTLSFIRKARYWKDNKYVFLVDAGYSPKVLDVINAFDGDKEIVLREATKYKLTKQSFNLLKGYEYAVSQSPEYVYLIEEDIFISNDFFDWHQKAQAKEKLFCSIATKNNSRPVPAEGKLNDYYTCHFNYQSLGVCFRTENLKLVLPHINHQYLADPVMYISRNFPKSKIGKYFCEQDGLIRRIQEQRPELPIAYPVIPRAFHGGFYGYNRTAKYKMPETWEERVSDIYRISFSDKELKNVVSQEFAYNDSRPFSLTIPKYGSINKVAHYN